MSVQRKQIDELIEKQANGTFCISLDWLSMYFKNTGFFEEEYTEGCEIIINEDIVLTAINRPTLHFNTHFVLFYKKEECAHVLMHSKNELFFAKDVVKVEFTNHTLYSGVWQIIYDNLNRKGLKYSSCSRIDIAIDGVGYLQEMLNIYAKQNKNNESILLKNNSEKRSIFSAKVLNPKTRLFENFNIGSSGGNKMITIYNKSLEIVKSGKNYIQEFWLKNGVVNKLADLNAQIQYLKSKEKRGTQAYYIEGQENIYRFEIRLKSESIKEIKKFSIDLLKTPEGLISIVRTHCRKYFEACYNDNENVSRCTNINLLPYDKFGGKLLSKIERVEKDGLYKAKLSIHGIVQDLYKGYIEEFRTNEAIEMIRDRVSKYKLESYLEKKLPEWQAKYKKFIDKSRTETLNFIIKEIGNSTETEDTAERNGNAYATAAFGDD
jgi:hypothetical protein